MKLNTPEITIRKFDNGSDRAFVFSSWLRSYKHESRFAKPITRRVFFEFHHKVLEHIFAHPNTSTVVAVLTEEPSVILGFITYTADSSSAEPRDVIHFCYVKKAFRRLGIASRMFHEANLTKEFIHTHETYDFDHIKEKNPYLVYNPYLV